MKREFVTYEQALALKELGFDEASICYYDIEDSYKLKPTPMKEEINAFRFNSTSIMVAAPLYQQVLRWFRDKHNLIGWVEFNMGFGFMYVIDMNYILKFRPFNTYEEAENECISKLIEITKQQDNGHN